MHDKQSKQQNIYKQFYTFFILKQHFFLLSTHKQYKTRQSKSTLCEYQTKPIKMSIPEKLKLYTWNKNKTLFDRILCSSYVKTFRRCAIAAAFKGVLFLEAWRKQLSAAFATKIRLLLCRWRQQLLQSSCKNNRKQSFYDHILSQ